MDLCQRQQKRQKQNVIKINRTGDIEENFDIEINRTGDIEEIVDIGNSSLA